MAKVSGTITLKGAPVAGAQVVFTSKGGAARNAIGTTDDQGKYQLTTFDQNDGAVIGSHSVTVSMATTSEEASNASAEDPTAAYGSAMDAAASGAAPADEGPIPSKYAAPGTSGLEAEVTEDGSNEFNFDLE